MRLGIAGRGISARALDASTLTFGSKPEAVSNVFLPVERRAPIACAMRYGFSRATTSEALRIKSNNQTSGPRARGQTSGCGAQKVIRPLSLRRRLPPAPVIVPRELEPMVAFGLLN